jgi:hypothetical protein
MTDLRDVLRQVDAVAARFDSMVSRRDATDYDHPYAWHKKNVERTEKKYETVRRRLTDKAIAEGHGHTRPTELRKVPEFAQLYAEEDQAYDELKRAQDYAVKEKAGYSDGSSNYRFGWYTSAECAKWRRQAKKFRY